MYDRLLEVGAELGMGKIKVGGGVFEEGELRHSGDARYLRQALRAGGPLGIDIVIEFLPFASINTIDRGPRSSKARHHQWRAAGRHFGTSIAAA